MKLEFERNKNEFTKLKSFTKKFPKRMNDFIRLVNLDMAQQAKADIEKLISDPEYKSYVDSLRPVLIEGSNEAALVSIEDKVSVGELDGTVDVCYFVQEIGDKTGYGSYLTKHGPYVLGFIKEVPEGVSMVSRRVTKDERAVVMQDNLDKRDELNDIRFAHKGRLLTIKDSYIDVLFVIRRLEFGVSGMPHRPHWQKIAGSVNEYAKNAMKKLSLFDDKTLPVPVADLIREEQAEELSDFQEKFN